MDLYEALGADPAEGEAELRRRYLSLARRYHPDQLTDASAAERDSAEERMRSVNEAWAVLGDKARRLRYDQSLFEVRHEAAKEEWKPFDDGDDPPYEEPIAPGRARPSRWLTVTPPLLVAAGILAFVFGALTLPALLWFGVILIAVGALSFVLVPFAVMVMSARSEKR